MPLQWKGSVLTSVLPGNSVVSLFFLFLSDWAGSSLRLTGSLWLELRCLVALPHVGS